MFGGNKPNLRRRFSHREEFIAFWIIFTIVKAKITLIRLKFENSVILIREGDTDCETPYFPGDNIIYAKIFSL